MGSRKLDNSVSRIVKFYVKWGQRSFLFTLICMAWVVWRISTKPTRINYPCSQFALGQVALFVGSVSLPLASICPKFVSYIRQREYVKIAGIALIILVLVGSFNLYSNIRDNQLRVAGSDTIPVSSSAISSQVNTTEIESISLYLEFPQTVSTDQAVVSVSYNPSIYYGGTTPYNAGVNPAYDFVWETIARLQLGSTGNPLDDLIDSGNTVLVKPNWVDYGPAVYTRPEVVRPLIDMAIIAGATTIYIGDGGGNSALTESVMDNANYTAMADELGSLYPGINIEAINLNSLSYGWHWINMDADSSFAGSGYSHYDLAAGGGTLYGHPYYSTSDNQSVNPTGDTLGWYAVNDKVLEADVIINVSKMKTHQIMMATMAIKNLVGCTIGSTYDEEADDSQPRIPHHNTDMEENYFNNDIFWRAILDMNKVLLYTDENGVIQPTQQRQYLNVVDGIQAMEKSQHHVYGEGGIPYDRHVILASVDPVAVDAVGSRIMGYDYSVIPSIGNADSDAVHPIGISDPEKIVVIGDEIDSEINHVFQFNPAWEGDASALAITDFTPPAINSVNRIDTAVSADISGGLAAYILYQSGGTQYIEKMTRVGDIYSGVISGTTTEYQILAQDEYFNTVQSILFSVDDNNETVVEGLSLVPTCQSIGVYSSFSGDENENSQAILEYRISGTTPWLPAPALTVDRRDTVVSNDSTISNPYKNQYRGSVLYLEANTEYEVRITYSDEGVSPSVQEFVTTLNDNPPSTGATYYVATTGNDMTGDGSMGTPWLTIQKAADSVSAGDTVLIMPGTYIEQINLSVSGNTNNYITFRSHDPNNKAMVVSSGQGTFNLNNIGYIRLKDLDIAGDDDDASCIFIEGSNSDGNIVEDCDLSSVGTNWWAGGVVVYNGPTNTLIQRNYISTTADATEVANTAEGPFGVLLNRTDGATVIRNNTIIGSFYDGIGGAPNFGINGGPYHDSDINDNYFEDIVDDAIESEGGNINVRIWGNEINNPDTMGLGIGSTIIGPLHIFRNTIQGHPDAAIKMGHDSSGTTYIYHNTIYTTEIDGCGPTDFAGYLGIGNVISRNNIYQVGRYVIETIGIDLGGNDYDYDNMFTTDPERFVKWHGANYTSLTIFQTEIGQELHALTADSDFIDPANYDLTLQLTSPCIDQGVILPGFNDTNSPWPYQGSAPDLGAYEAPIAPDNDPPNQPTLVVPPDEGVDISTNPALEVSVSDPDADPLDVTFYGREDEDFTIIVLPDTQNYSRDYPEIFTSQTQWIVDNYDAADIIYVAHEGDIVDTASNTTQWNTANTSMSLLEDPVTTGLADGIPYGVLPGNHDQPTTNYNIYFGVSRFDGRGYYGGHYGSNNDNNYSLFSAAGMDFIVINLQYTPGAAVLDWADALLKTYGDRRAIVVSHTILDTDGTWDYELIFTELQDNPNLFLMLCGHLWGEAQRTEEGEFGNTIHILLANYQQYPNGGNGYLRILEFSPADDEISVETYSPWLDSYQTDSDSQFILPYDMEDPESYIPLGTDSGVASGGNASFTWLGLAEYTTYQWYIELADGSEITTGPTWSFVTGNEVPPPAPELISPGTDSPPGPVIGTLAPTLTWSDIGVVDRYCLLIRDAATNEIIFNNLVSGISIEGTSYELSLGILESGKVYRWSLCAHNVAGWGPWSDGMYFQGDD